MKNNKGNEKSAQTSQGSEHQNSGEAKPVRHLPLEGIGVPASRGEIEKSLADVKANPAWIEILDKARIEGASLARPTGDTVALARDLWETAVSVLLMLKGKTAEQSVELTAGIMAAFPGGALLDNARETLREFQSLPEKALNALSVGSASLPFLEAMEWVHGNLVWNSDEPERGSHESLFVPRWQLAFASNLSARYGWLGKAYVVREGKWVRVSSLRDEPSKRTGEDKGKKGGLDLSNLAL